MNYDEFVAKYGNRPKDILFFMAVKLERERIEQRILSTLKDWDRMTLQEGGEEKWQKKYGVPTTDLIAVIERTLRGEDK